MSPLRAAELADEAAAIYSDTVHQYMNEGDCLFDAVAEAVSGDLPDDASDELIDEVEGAVFAALDARHPNLLPEDAR